MQDLTTFNDESAGEKSVLLSGFLERAVRRELRVAVLGLGYVGLPLALRCVEAGWSVIGLDIDPDKVRCLLGGESYIRHIEGGRIQSAGQAGWVISSDMALARAADVILLCVPTPLDRHREPDLRFVLDSMESLGPYLREGQLLVLESTTYPGTTEEELRPRIEAQGLRVGVDFYLGYSPEREDPGNPQFQTQSIPKLVSGSSEACLQAAKAVYSGIVDQIVPVSSTRVAEMTKLMENIHRAVNIGLVNEMKIAADKMGVDIHEVIDAASTKPFGFVPYRPGPGLGGHCIPIDPFYLTWKAREYGVHTRFIELAGEINSGMPDWVMQKIRLALNEHDKPVKGSRVLLLGLAYKKNIDDLRHSPALMLLELLRKEGAILSYCDPYVPKIPSLREHCFDLVSEVMSSKLLADKDCVVLATDHDDFDYEQIRESSKLLIDTRGRYRGMAGHIVHA